MDEKTKKQYYLSPVKVVRDLVHGYVSLTKFDIVLIDTAEFQRLKDIRQLTCQHVYPAARHTRFEHSLGVLELMRTVIKHLNNNKVLGYDKSQNQKIYINENLQFNASIAALLHDVGHCPFSHMGEQEFDSEKVRNYLADKIKGKVSDELYTRINDKNQKSGSVHEQLSCIIIMEKYFTLLDSINIIDENVDLEADFELIIRSILGIEYDTSTIEKFNDNKYKNIIVTLLNSKIFDVDKLDYIMRDSYLTGIGTPIIDTKRLFRNMYLTERFSFVFTSKAVPALQNMIDSRDGLYMYVYNHHAVIFSDFLNTYIARRLSHNAEYFLLLTQPDSKKEDISEAVDFLLNPRHSSISKENFFSLGLVPTSYLFSVDAILKEYRSDSDWISLLNNLYIEDFESPKIDLIIDLYKKNHSETISSDNEDIKKHLVSKIKNVKSLVSNLKERKFLKPWWKTVFEFSNFMQQNFKDDVIRKHVGKYICNGGDFGLEADEFRSQIAKHIIYITQELAKSNHSYIKQPLKAGDFFVIQRSTRFFSPDTIEKLEIGLKCSEIIGPLENVKYQYQEHYIKSLTNLNP